MAGKITELDALTDPQGTDILEIVDDPGGTPVNKKITVANLGEGINPMTTAGDLIIGGASGALSRLAIGANTTVLTSNGTTAAWAAAGGGLTDGTFTDYSSTSTIVGWVSFTTKTFYYKTIGKTVFVYIAFSGTSNSSELTFTLPYNVATGCSIIQLAFIGNNGTRAVGFIYPLSSSTIAVVKDLSANGFTASGTKELYMSFSYQAE